VSGVARARAASVARARRELRGMRDLAVMNPDPAFLPPLSLAGGGARRLYTDIVDDEELLAFARRTMTADGVDATHVGVASGAMDAIEQALFALAEPGATIAIEDPGYPRYALLAAALGLRTVRLAMDPRGITPKALGSALAAGASVVVVTPRAQNPTGASFDTERADELRAILDAAPHVAVVEDDYLAYVCGVPLQTLTPGRLRFLHVRSLAKTIGPDCRVAPFAADAETFARIAARRRVGAGWVSVMLQEGAAAALRELDAAGTLAAARHAYDARRTLLLDACARQGLHALGAAGFVVWIAVADEAAALRAASEAGFRLAAGAPYRGDAPPGVRVTTTTLTATEAETLAHALAST
jgi:DNA-binding transcriptional MocR family regulator